MMNIIFLTKKNIYITFCCIVLFCACTQRQVNKSAQNKLSDNQIVDTLIDANKVFLLKEKSKIEDYCSHLPYQFVKTGSGLLYYVGNTLKGNSPIANQMVQVTYAVSLLNGEKCYATEKSKPESFKVDNDHVEKGLHEGIKLMHIGETAKFIIPSHLAHGLLGDLNKIPPRSALVYDVTLVKIK